MRTTNSRRGGALLAVMWLSAALAAIAFSIATSVHGETERTSTSVDEVRAYYLATGALDRAIMEMQWGAPYFTPGQGSIDMQFPTGQATVEIIPEAAKLNINLMAPEQLFLLLRAVTHDDQNPASSPKASSTGARLAPPAARPSINITPRSCRLFARAMRLLKRLRNFSR